jgi:hypothetical protein
MPRSSRRLGVRLREEVLLACAAERDWSTLPADLDAMISSLVDIEGLDQLVEAAEWHRVDGCVWLALRPFLAGLPRTEAISRLEERYHGSVVNHLRTLAELRRTDAAFAGASIPYVVVKGPVLAEHVYPRSDLRSYTDLDLLVAPAMLESAVSALLATGAIMLDANWPMLERRMVGEIHLATSGGVVIDLHWSLLHDAPARRSFRVPTTELVSRSRLLRILDMDIPALAEPDALVHLALHAAQSGADRLGWLKDVERSIASMQTDWSAVTSTAQGWRAQIPVAEVIDRVRRAFRTPIPTQVLSDLAPPRLWRAVATSANAVSPVGRSRRAGSASRIVAKAARGGSAESLVELTRRSAAWAVHGHARSQHRALWDPTDSLSAAYPAGDPATFYRAVLNET